MKTKTLRDVSERLRNPELETSSFFYQTAPFKMDGRTLYPHPVLVTQDTRGITRKSVLYENENEIGLMGCLDCKDVLGISYWIYIKNPPKLKACSFVWTKKDEEGFSELNELLIKIGLK